VRAARGTSLGDSSTPGNCLRGRLLWLLAGPSVSVFVMKVTSATQFGDRVLATGRVGSQSLRVRVAGAQGRDVLEGFEVLVGWRQCDLHVIPESPAA
jgi:hypothetical protein